jgi:predicted methyltransferase
VCRAQVTGARLVNTFVTPSFHRHTTVLTSSAMHGFFAAIGLIALFSASAVAQDATSGATFRYRAAIAALLQLKPGMVAAEVGPAPGFIAAAMEPLVAPGGRVITRPAAGALAPTSVDAIAVVSVFGGVEQRKEMLQALATALKPGGALLIVDMPAENDGRKVIGIEADDVVKLATEAGFRREAESGIVPGHYAIRFRKP